MVPGKIRRKKAGAPEHHHPPAHRRESTREIWENALDRFARCDDVDFAYPTSRSYNNGTEGKRGTGASGTIAGTHVLMTDPVQARVAAEQDWRATSVIQADGEVM